MSRNAFSQFTFSTALGLLPASCVAVTLQRTTPTTTGGGASPSGPGPPVARSGHLRHPARSPADARQSWR